MPMTCRKREQEECQGTHDFIGKIQSKVNEEYLRALIEGGLDSLRVELLDGVVTAEIRGLQQCLQTATQCELLGIFFLILNIDQGLKQTVFDQDVPTNNLKITRFMQDLQQDIVTKFFCSSQSMSEFVQECYDIYSIA